MGAGTARMVCIVKKVLLLFLLVSLLPWGFAVAKEEALAFPREEVELLAQFPWDAAPAELPAETYAAYLSGLGYESAAVNATPSETGGTVYLYQAARRPYRIHVSCYQNSLYTIALRVDQDLTTYDALKGGLASIFGVATDGEDMHGNEHATWNIGNGLYLRLAWSSPDSLVSVFRIFFAREMTAIAGIAEQSPAFSEAGIATAAEATAAFLAAMPAAVEPPAMAASSGFSIRNGVAFGMSRAEVVAAEGKAPGYEQDGSLYYLNETILGVDTALNYDFTAGGMSSINYLFLTEHVAENQYIADFESVRASLTEKYGTPKMVQQKWINERYKDNEADWGYAISTGDLQYAAGWDLADVSIVLVMYGSDGDINIILNYEPPEPVAGVADTFGL